MHTAHVISLICIVLYRVQSCTVRQDHAWLRCRLGQLLQLLMLTEAHCALLGAAVGAGLHEQLHVW
jgi:hypothetical protein